jgi:glutamine kinase
VDDAAIAGGPGTDLASRSTGVVILGAGRGVRGAMPSAMVDIDEKGRVLDWLLDAFASLDAPEVCFVAGFKADEVMERYPNVRTVFNRDWARTGPVQSLGLVPFDTAAHMYVCYSDVVFRRSAVEALRDCDRDVAIAIDTSWRSRFDGRTAADLDRAEKVRIADGQVAEIGPHIDSEQAGAEFAGVLRLGRRASDAVFAAIRSGAFSSTATLPDLIRRLLAEGLSVGAVDLEGAWAELDAKQDLARFVLGTKAESLERLRQMQHGGEIGPLIAFTMREWIADRATVVDEVLQAIPGDRLIVRSSALSEDSWLESKAGRHESVLDVERSPAAIGEAVDSVLASYGAEDLANQVLVQEMLHDVAMSGVVMTRTHALGAPYYVINFDDSTARTDTVTGGAQARTIFVHRDSSLHRRVPQQLSAVLLTVQNIEKLVGHDSLDIEFAVTAQGQVHILQVRPIAVTHAPQPIDDTLVATALGRARRFLDDRVAPSPTLLGHSTQYSVMSDWNPAEIIGTKPKRLALSLYRFLITDEVWARQRAEYGYRDVRPCPLLVDLIGHPYVDVRATFNSFVPSAVRPELAERLVDHYLAHLAAEPNLHDKVEFDVLFTCLTPSFGAEATRLSDAGLSSAEIDELRHALRDISIGAFDRLDDDLARLPAFEKEIDRIDAVARSPLEAAYHQLEICRRVGTPVFAHLARGAFVATSLLRSLEDVGAIDAAQSSQFLGSIETVLGRMRRDGRRVGRGEMSFDDFVAAYGHLRPGTYDITSPCYRAAADAYLRPVVDAFAHDADEVVAPLSWPVETQRSVMRALRDAGLPDDFGAVESFVRRAIAGREDAKFVFTKALSRALEYLVEFGATLGFDRDDLAHVRIQDLLACEDVLADAAGFLSRRVLEGREAYHVTQGVCLPGHIAGPTDLVCFEQRVAEPNFVTQRVVEGGVVAENLTPTSDVDGHIVLIPSADPGYDWLLARGIQGLITMYGGANSHMAVRAAELQLPAAIGVGELLYESLVPARVIRLDCASRTITPVR